jgi:alpha-L-arabinofuranosidase
VTCTGAAGLTAAGGITTTATVDFGTTTATMSSQGIGVDTAVYDNGLISGAVATALKAAGVQALRYPGGSYADIFNWQTTTGNDGAYVVASDTFQAWMTTDVIPSGAQPIITVNYGSNTTNSGPADPSEAAAWVQYANVTNNYGIKYWEIGNENVGDGYYAGEDWEYDLHYLDQTAADRVGQSVLSPLAYGTNSVAFITAMKAIDPTIKCGVYQLAPDVYPNTADPSYNAQVLQGAGTAIDFVIIHWYPCATDAATCVQSPLQIPAIVSGTQAELAKAIPSKASQIELLITESGAGDVTGPPTALYAADEYASWFENGVVNVEYQELHAGFLTSGDTPLGPYYGAKMASILASAGDSFVTATSASTMIGIHAVKKTNGNDAVMLVNRDPTNSYTVTVSVTGATLGNCGTRYDFGQANFNGTNPSSGEVQSTVSGFNAGSFTITVPAYTISIVENPG